MHGTGARLTGVWARNGLATSGTLNPLGLIMFDADRFKSFNDEFGHVAGDEALIDIARVASQPLRTSDFLSRYGGEEFSVILPETPLNGALVVAERIRIAVESAGWPRKKMTVSIGVAAFQPSRGTDQNILVAQADQALYAAKQAGRNRIAAFDQWIGEKQN